MHPSVRFREASRDDLPDILRLYAQPALDDGDVLPVAQAERIYERTRAYPDYTLHVAIGDGRIVGSFALLVMDNLAHRGTPSAVIEDVAVDPQWQGRGVGRAMMRHALRLAHDKGRYKATLSSSLKRSQAHAFYDSLGFERHGYSFRADLLPSDER
jgi:GNAT superfamily N-acetyltransferase